MKPNSPSVSVLIPCHNGARWLESAVLSISRQTYQEIEILIYDDGSTDDSDSIIELLKKGDERIASFGSSVNFGIVHALNSLLGAAKGRYIARMDCDDISYPNRIERQIQFLETHNLDLCGSWFQEFGDGISRKVCWPTGSEEVQAALLFQNSICHPTILGRREVFDEFGYREDHNLAEDYDLFVRASTKFRLSNIPEVLLRYRRHKHQATQSRRDAMETVTQSVRIDALKAKGIHPTALEQHTHNSIRSPHSIRSLEAFLDVEAWLLKLGKHFDDPEAVKVVASQWTRAAVRAAPLGALMWHTYRQSPLRDLMGRRKRDDIDLALLAISRIDYNSKAFDALRRFGLGA